MLSFYSHVNYSVTKIRAIRKRVSRAFYSHVNYSVTKMLFAAVRLKYPFYSHVNYSVTKISKPKVSANSCFTVT